NLERVNADMLELKNMSRVVCVPCREETIRGFSDIDLLIIDEAARVPDNLYRAVRPMLAVSKGRLIALSTPYGQRGWFWNAWAREGTGMTGWPTERRAQRNAPVLLNSEAT